MVVRAAMIRRRLLLPVRILRRHGCEPYDMVSVVTMLRRMLGAIKYAAKEESFAAVVGAAIVLVLVGTVTYSLGEGWNVADGFYFAVCTLTTSSIADPNLTLTHETLKIFTAMYVLTGIGILVELARQLGVGFVRMREEHKATRHARHHEEDPPAAQSAE
jgi:Ion channel